MICRAVEYWAASTSQFLKIRDLSKEAPTGKPLAYSIYFRGRGEHYSGVVRLWGFEPVTPTRVYSSLPLHLKLTRVYNPFWFTTYYTKPIINWLFEDLNDFKWKFVNYKVS
jgi:hypothetical protein